MRRIASGRPEIASWRIVLLPIALGWLAAAPTHAAEPLYAIPGASIDRGRAMIQAAGCAACHTVPGVRQALANIGPPLTRIGDRTYIAGVLPNTPDNLVRWIRFPQSVVPGNAMPDMNLSESEARDIAAFLYTLH